MDSKYLPLINFFKIHKSHASRLKYLKDYFPEILEKINMANFAKELYDEIFHITEIPYCLFCNVNPKKFLSFDDGYLRFCSHKCSTNHPNTIAKRKSTNKNIYGNETVILVPEIKAKRDATMIERHGFMHALQNKELLEKALASNLNRSSEEKITSQLQKKRTLINKFGTTNLETVPEIKARRIATTQRNLGVNYPQQSEKIKEKGRTTRRLNFTKNLQDRVPNSIPLFEDFRGINLDGKPIHYKWSCNTCFSEFESHIDNGALPRCETCLPKKHGSSLGQMEVISFIRSLNIECENKNTNIIGGKKELDIYIASHNLAIEYCGIYWHSEKHTQANDHLYKLQICNSKKLRLITIFEDEWQQNRTICENRILHALGLTKKLCGAREVTISLITSKQAREFLNQHHIQAYVNSRIKYGAYYKNDLVSVMTFGSKRIALGSNKRLPATFNHFEMLRFASSGNIPGIANKFFKQFIKDYNPEQVISYCDRRWGNGEVYLKLGFNFSHHSNPGYWYSKDGLIRLHRYNFAKHRLPALGYTRRETANEFIKKLGYYKIYDCGQSLFIWNR